MNLFFVQYRAQIDPRDAINAFYQKEPGISYTCIRFEEDSELLRKRHLENTQMLARANSLLNSPLAYRYFFKRKIAGLTKQLNFQVVADDQKNWKGPIAKVFDLTVVDGQKMINDLVGEKIRTFWTLINEQIQSENFSDFKSVSKLNDLCSNNLKNQYFDSTKTSELNDFKSVNITKRLKVVYSRGLLPGLNADFSDCLGVDQAEAQQWMNDRFSKLFALASLTELKSSLKPIRLKLLLIKMQPYPIQYLGETLKPFIKLAWDNSNERRQITGFLINEEENSVPNGLSRFSAEFSLTKNEIIATSALNANIPSNKSYKILFNLGSQLAETDWFVVHSKQKGRG